MIRIAMVLAAGLALAGCQAQATGWAKPGASAAQTERDFKECEYEALKAAQPAEMGFAGGLDQGMRRSQIRQQCMDLRGYRAG